MSTFAQGLVGVFWTLTYIEIIYRGVRNKTYGMPIIAFWANIVWEFYWTFIQRPPGSSPLMSTAQLIVDATWLAFDCMIMLTVLRYGPREFPEVRKLFFYSGLAVSGVLTAVIEVLLTRGFDRMLIVPVVFGSNLLMSALFIQMLLARRSRRGQSVTIALNKLLGTAFASVGVYLYAPKSVFTATALLPVLYAGCFILDMTYLVMIATMYRRSQVRRVLIP